MSGVVLRAEALVKRYGLREVLGGLSLEVRRGEVVGLLGHNGAGKSTCLELLAGAQTTDGGRIWLEGQEVGAWPLHRRARAGLLYLAQEPAVLRGLSVEANLGLVRTSEGESLEPKRRDAALAAFRLQGVRRSLAGGLSGGERRRLELARVWLQRPVVVILDEPLAGLDGEGVQEVLDWLGRLAAEGAGVLWTEHQVQLLAERSDRLYLLEHGRLSAGGGRAEVLAGAGVQRLYPGLWKGGG